MFDIGLSAHTLFANSKKLKFPNRWMRFFSMGLSESWFNKPKSRIKEWIYDWPQIHPQDLTAIFENFDVRFAYCQQENG